MVKDIEAIFPKPYRGIQVNYCVSTGCENFGQSDASLYDVVINDKSLNIYYCPKCGAYPQFVDNRAVYQTIQHQKQYHSLSLTACPTKACPSYLKAVHANLKRYRAFGKTSSLKQRYQCLDCKKVFTDQLSCENTNSEIQSAMFYGMMYSFGVRNICQKLSITAKAFYKVQRNMVDRLKYVAHVKEATYYRDKSECSVSTCFQFVEGNEGTVLVASAEVQSGYILAFDTNLSTEVSAECRLALSSKQQKYDQPAISEHSDLMMKITSRYETILARRNYLDPTSDGRPLKHSYKGVLSQPYLASFAHALVLREKLKHKSKRYFFVEQDTMLRNAFLNSSLHDLLKSNDHLFYYQESAQKMDWFNDEKLNIRHVGWWRDKWGFCSLDNKTKASCHIQGQNLSLTQWKSLLNQANLDGVDHYLSSLNKFFQGLGTSLNEQSINDWLHIFTGCYNYCWPQADGKTPAQRLGLFDRPMSLGELLNGHELWLN